MSKFSLLDVVNYGLSREIEERVKVHARPVLRQLLARYDAIQEDKADSEELLEELENQPDYKSAEERQDMIDGWTSSEAEIGTALVKLLREEN